MTRTKYFIDTEFIEDGNTIDLISIGIVCDDGRELYLVNKDCDLSAASLWVKDNVIPLLPDRNLNLSDPSVSPNKKSESLRWKTKQQIADAVKDFCNPIVYGKPQFWAYYADYDWVVFCQLFGTMMQLPPNFPMYCMDLKQWCVQLGDPALEVNNGKHNAIEDAKWNKRTWEYLNSLQNLRFKPIDQYVSSNQPVNQSPTRSRWG